MELNYGDWLCVSWADAYGWNSRRFKKVGNLSMCYRFRIDPVPCKHKNIWANKGYNHPKYYKKKITLEYHWLDEEDDSSLMLFKNAKADDIWDSDPWGEFEHHKWKTRYLKCWKDCTKKRKQWM